MAEENVEDESTQDKLHFQEFITSAWEGQTNKVAELIEKVADLNESDKEGFTVLHAATSTGKTNLIQLLIDKGACVNQQSKTKLTPLHIAVQEHLPETVRLLLRNGADKNLKDQNGNTPLLQATIFIRHYLNMVDILTEDTSPSPYPSEKPRYPVSTARRISMLTKMAPKKSLDILSEDQEWNDESSSSASLLTRRSTTQEGSIDNCLSEVTSISTTILRILEFDGLMQFASPRLPASGLTARTSVESTVSTGTDTSSSRFTNPSSESYSVGSPHESLNYSLSSSSGCCKEAKNDETPAIEEPKQEPPKISEEGPYAEVTNFKNLQSIPRGQFEFSEDDGSSHYLILNKPAVALTPKSSCRRYQLMSRLTPNSKDNDAATTTLNPENDSSGDDDDYESYYINVGSTASANSTAGLDKNQTKNSNRDTDSPDKRSSQSEGDGEIYEKLIRRKHCAVLIEENKKTGQTKTQWSSSSGTTFSDCGNPLYEELQFYAKKTRPSDNIGGSMENAIACEKSPSSSSPSSSSWADKKIKPNSDPELYSMNVEKMQSVGRLACDAKNKDCKIKKKAPGKIPEKAMGREAQGKSKTETTYESSIPNVRTDDSQCHREVRAQAEREEEEKDSHQKSRVFARKKLSKKETHRWIWEKRFPQNLGGMK